MNPSAPESFLDCFDANGDFDQDSFTAFFNSAPEGSFVRKHFNLFDDAAEEQRQEKTKRTKRKRETRERKDPKESTWYRNYVAHSPTSKKGLKKFRRRFRLPYSSYLRLLRLSRERNWFPRAERKDATGRPGTPLELLILGALRYLGRGWTFDDLEEATDVSEEVHRLFLLDFVKVSALLAFLYSCHVSGASAISFICVLML